MLLMIEKQYRNPKASASIRYPTQIQTTTMI